MGKGETLPIFKEICGSCSYIVNNCLKILKPKYKISIEAKLLKYCPAGTILTSTDKTSKTIENAGCGLISMCNIFTYLAKTNSSMKSLTTVNTSNYPLSYGQFTTYVRSIENNYLPINPILGSNGISIANAMKKYAKDKGISLKASYISNGVSSKKGMLDKIEKAMKNDVPLTLSLSPTAYRESTGSSHWEIESGYTSFPFKLYSVDETAKKPYQLDSSTYYGTTKGHYVTITGLIIDKIDGKTKLVISNWGMKQVVDYDNFFDDGDVFSGIVYIEK